MKKKSCESCRIGKSIGINSDILCLYKGVVSYDYSCSKYKPVIIDKNVNRCIECTFFNLQDNDLNTTDSIGLCQLFSVRHYDGNTKKACSKFTKKLTLEVS